MLPIQICMCIWFSLTNVLIAFFISNNSRVFFSKCLNRIEEVSSLNLLWKRRNVSCFRENTKIKWDELWFFDSFFNFFSVPSFRIRCEYF